MLKNYIEKNYKENPVLAVSELSDEEFLKSRGWKRVFHEGVGEGVYSPKEGIVAVFDEEDLDTYTDYTFYKYNPNAWVTMEELFNENKTGEECEVELV